MYSFSKLSDICFAAAFENGNIQVGSDYIYQKNLFTYIALLIYIIFIDLGLSHA